MAEKVYKGPKDAESSIIMIMKNIVFAYQSKKVGYVVQDSQRLGRKE